jgi:hypothetical protein
MANFIAKILLEAERLGYVTINREAMKRPGQAHEPNIGSG